QGLVEHAGSTPDGLPLYAVTSEGERVAGLWMSTPDVSALPEWTEMLDQVLVSSSVEPASALSLGRAYRRWWETDLAETRSSLASGQGDRLALLAREAQSVAALA